MHKLLQLNLNLWKSPNQGHFSIHRPWQMRIVVQEMYLHFMTSSTESFSMPWPVFINRLCQSTRCFKNNENTLFGTPCMKMCWISSIIKLNLHLKFSQSMLIWLTIQTNNLFIKLTISLYTKLPNQFLSCKTLCLFQLHFLFLSVK